MSPRKRPSTGSIVDVHFAPSIGSESSHECHSPLQLRLFGFDRPAISGNPSSKADVAAYESLRVRAGREPAAQIQVALWCEQHGMTAEKVKHLAPAVLRDPQNAMARGLLGLLPSGGKWETPEAVNARLSTDEGKMAKLAEYNRRRDELQALERTGFRLWRHRARSLGISQKRRRACRGARQARHLVPAERASARGDRSLHAGGRA